MPNPLLLLMLLAGKVMLSFVLELADLVRVADMATVILYLFDTKGGLTQKRPRRNSPLSCTCGTFKKRTAWLVCNRHSQKTRWWQTVTVDPLGQRRRRRRVFSPRRVFFGPCLVCCNIHLPVFFLSFPLRHSFKTPHRPCGHASPFLILPSSDWHYYYFFSAVSIAFFTTWH